MIVFFNYLAVLVFSFFASPVPVLLVIIAKIFFGKKYTKKAFVISLLILVLIASLITLAFFMPRLSSFFLETRNVTEVFNNLVWGPIFIACYLFIELFVYLFPVLLIGCVIYYLKSKDKEVFKKFFITALILVPFVAVSFPLYALPIDLFRSYKIDKNGLEKFKNAERMIVLPPIRGIITQCIADNIYNEYLEIKYPNKLPFTEVSAEDTKLIDEYIKYKTISCDILGYDFDFAGFMGEVKRLDEALKVMDKIDERLGYMHPRRVKIYIKNKEFQKAQDIIDKVYYPQNATWKYVDYISLYAGMGEYEKAYKYLKEYKKHEEQTKDTDLWFYNKIKIYLDYKSGKVQQAKNEFKELKHSGTFEQYIGDLEKSWY